MKNCYIYSWCYYWLHLLIFWGLSKYQTNKQHKHKNRKQIDIIFSTNLDLIWRAKHKFYSSILSKINQNRRQKDYLDSSQKLITANVNQLKVIKVYEINTQINIKIELSIYYFSPPVCWGIHFEKKNNEKQILF